MYVSKGVVDGLLMVWIGRSFLDTWSLVVFVNLGKNITIAMRGATPVMQILNITLG